MYIVKGSPDGSYFMNPPRMNQASTFPGIARGIRRLVPVDLFATKKMSFKKWACEDSPIATTTDDRVNHVLSGWNQ
jgi:hypothetical protein